MNILKDAVFWTEHIEGMNGVHDATIKLVEAESALDVAAAASQLAAELAITAAVTGTLRTSMTALRLGLVVSGQMWKWEALSWAAGVSSGLTAGGIIDWVNEQKIGVSIYDLTNSSSENSNNFITNLQANFYQAEVTRSPLILDLDGDGIETIGKSAGIHFDHDGNQFAKTTGWVGKDDGLLVWDRNGNGFIDDGSELFGNNTALDTGSKAANGFAALADLDSNHDNKIDASDTAFTQLRIWKDADSNAVTSDGELLTLDAVGVGSISLTYTTKSITDAQGNQHLQVGTYTQLDGTIHAMDDVWFAADTARTLELDKIAVSDDIAALPELIGFGSVHSLHQAMARDTSGRLKSLVNNLIDEDSLDAKRAIMTTLVYVWAGVEGIDPASRAATQIYGNVIGDARKLATLEAFLGEAYLGTWCGGTSDPNPHGVAAPILLKAFDQLVDHYFAQLLESTLLQGLFKSIGLDWDLTTGKFKIDVSTALDEIRTYYANNPKDGLSLMWYFGQSLHAKGSFGDEILAAFRQNGDLKGSNFDRSLLGLSLKMLLGNNEANSLLADLAQASMLDGLGGNDVLTGSSLNDIIVGGNGNDNLIGGTGNDNYLFVKGDGNDCINEYDTTVGNSDIVQFADINSNELTTLQRLGDDLVLKYGSADQLTVSNYFRSAYYRIEQFNFADGISLDNTAIKARVMTTGTAGRDYIYGYNDGTNRIFGFDGNDYLSGGSEDDLIDGGNGSDVLYGYGGNDSLLGGTGNDYLYAATGIDTLLGGDGDDALFGGDGDDWLDGGNGNDVMNGGNGNDSYLVHSGGVDRVSDSGSGFDVLQFADVASTDIQCVQRLRDDLIFNYGTTDQLIINNYFGSAFYRLEQLNFSDGVSWDDAAIKARVMTTGTAGSDYIYGYDDAANRITGLDGNDSISGGSKDDLMDGGNGNDSLSGYVGNDLLFGGLGDDALDGGTGNDTLLAGDGNDNLYGGDGDDLLDGGSGNEVMDGGSGNDSYILRGAGVHRIYDSRGGLDNVQITDVASTDITTVERRVNDLVLQYGNADQLTVTNYFSNAYYRIEQFAFADGVSWHDLTIKTRTVTWGTAGADYISGYDEAPNSMAGLDGSDTLYGGSKDDLIDGGNGNDNLYGNAGNDILQGKAGTDNLYDTTGNNLFDGGADNDTLTGGTGNELFIGGAGNDVINTGSGADIIVFNRGDGQDTIQASMGKDNTISLGKGIAYDEVSLSKNGSDLILATGQSEQITLKNWYMNSSFHSIANLQFVTQASLNYDAASTDPLLNQKIQQFNFENIVSHFDQAQSANVGLSKWAICSALLDAHLARSDLAGLGGDLTYGYGKNGNLSDMDIKSAQAVLGSSQFGSANQILLTANAVVDSAPRLI